MLGALLVPLQREPRARLDHQSLHLEPGARVDGLVIAPRPVDTAVDRRLSPLHLFQLLDRELYVVSALARRDEERVAGLDDHQVLDADGGDQPAVAPQVAALAVMREHIA